MRAGRGIAMVVAGLCLGSCASPFASERDDAFPEGASWAVSEARSMEFAVAFGFGGRQVQLPVGTRRVIRSDDAWSAEWDQFGTWESRPPVDFDREMIVLVTEALDAEVDDESHIQAGLAGTVLRIAVSRLVWPESCRVPLVRLDALVPRIEQTVAWSRAYAVVVPRSHRPVEFIDRRIRRRCPDIGPHRDSPTESTGTSEPTPRLPP